MGKFTMPEQTKDVHVFGGDQTAEAWKEYCDPIGENGISAVTTFNGHGMYQLDRSERYFLQYVLMCIETGRLPSLMERVFSSQEGMEKAYQELYQHELALRQKGVSGGKPK